MLGDGGTPEIVPEIRDVDGTAMSIGTKDVLELIRPSQGGHVIFVGARATGLCASGATLTGRVLFPDGTFVSLESRSLDFEPIEDEPGWGRPDYSSIAGLANVPICPNNTGRPLLSIPMVLEVEVEDRQQRVAEARVDISLDCVQTDADCRALCECECDQEYDIGVGCDVPEGAECELQ